MVFSSISFLCFFLPALLAIYYITPVRFRRGRNLILLAGSLIFYAWGGSKYLLLLLLSVTVNYICGFLAAEGTGRTEAFRCRMDRNTQWFPCWYRHIMRRWC